MFAWLKRKLFGAPPAPACAHEWVQWAVCHEITRTDSRVVEVLDRCRHCGAARRRSDLVVFPEPDTDRARGAQP